MFVQIIRDIAIRGKMMPDYKAHQESNSCCCKTLGSLGSLDACNRFEPLVSNGNVTFLLRCLSIRFYGLHDAAYRSCYLIVITLRYGSESFFFLFTIFQANSSCNDTARLRCDRTILLEILAWKIAPPPQLSCQHP